MNPEPLPVYWIVVTPVRVDGKRWHHFKTSRERNAFHRKHGGFRYDMRRSKH